MNALLLISIVLLVSAQDVTKKIYNKRAAVPGTYFFVMISSASAALFFALTSGRLEFNTGIIPYSIFFAVSYTACVVGSVTAIASGPLSLTSLIASFSLMLPTLYGLIFLDEPIKIGFFPGLALLCASLFLVNKRDEDVKINVKWVIGVIFTFLGNGFCTVSQKMQQRAFNGDYKNEFMIIALLITALVTGIMVLTKEGSIVKKQTIGGYAIGVCCGAANGAANLFVMILSGLMPVSLMFPIISAGGIIATFIVSTVFYKEKLSKLQLIGFVLGTASVILLNL